jgi:hypothetical protein
MNPKRARGELLSLHVVKRKQVTAKAEIDQSQFGQRFPHPVFLKRRSSQPLFIFGLGRGPCAMIKFP